MEYWLLGLGLMPLLFFLDLFGIVGRDGGGEEAVPASGAPDDVLDEEVGEGDLLDDFPGPEEDDDVLSPVEGPEDPVASDPVEEGDILSPVEGPEEPLPPGEDPEDVLSPVDDPGDGIGPGGTTLLDLLLERDGGVQAVGTGGAGIVVERVVSSGAGDDSLVLTDAPDAAVLDSGGAIPLLTGDAVSVVDAGAGDDTVQAGAGSAYVFGGAGDDTLMAGTGAAALFGGAGMDTLTGGAGDSLLDGGSGNDVIEGGAGDEVIRGGTGADEIGGGDGDDVIYGGSVAGEIDGVADLLDGGAGQDVIHMDRADTATGGAGADEFWIYDDGDAGDNFAVIGDFASGEDVLHIALDPDLMNGEITLEVAPSEDGADGLVSVNGSVIAVLTGAPEASAGDVELSTLEPELP